MKCSACGNELYKSDIEKGTCPYCYGIVADEDSDANADEIADTLEKEWGIDADTAKAIVFCNLQGLMDRNMFITIDGDVFPAKDEEELREIMLQWLLDDKGVIDDIQYMFVDGIPKGLEVDLKFIDDIVEPEQILEELHSGSAIHD